MFLIEGATMKINDVIRTKRLELGMTQEQVATRLGVVSAESADDQDEYRSTIDANYRRLASSAEPAVREMATGMLIAQAMQDEDYAQAQELADRVSVSRATLSRLENGDPSVSFETFLRVCQGVGMLDKIPEAVDPYETDLGRIRADQSLPQRVRKPK